MKKLIVIFDDKCILCNNSVKFIIRLDKKRKFRFTALDSSFSCKLLKLLNRKEFSSVGFLEDDKLYLKSTAVLRIFKHLGYLWQFLYVFIIIPRPVRDFIYDFISKRRKKWFGVSNECLVCKTEGKERFIG